MTRPSLATDLYSDAALADPYPHYRTIRDLGPAVWLSAHDAWAIGRFEDVRAALRADDVLVSGHGVGTTIPAGARVLILFASGNRDERHYADPDRFDVTRDARDHLGFGHGVHRCAGSHVAQLEMQSLLRAMVARVATIEVGPPEVGLNNVLCGYRNFRASFRGEGMQ